MDDGWNKAGDALAEDQEKDHPDPLDVAAQAARLRWVGPTIVQVLPWDELGEGTRNVWRQVASDAISAFWQASA